LRIRYEDLARSPTDELHRLFERVSVGPKLDTAGLGRSDNRHQLYGNRMRHRTLSLMDVQEDTRWKLEMPSSNLWFVSCLSWPLRKRYGYNSNGLSTDRK
jgi:hypothetical protein